MFVNYYIYQSILKHSLNSQRKSDKKQGKREKGKKKEKEEEKKKKRKRRRGEEKKEKNIFHNTPFPAKNSGRFKGIGIRLQREWE